MLNCPVYLRFFACLSYLECCDCCYCYCSSMSSWDLQSCLWVSISVSYPQQLSCQRSFYWSLTPCLQEQQRPWRWAPRQDSWLLIKSRSNLKWYFGGFLQRQSSWLRLNWPLPRFSTKSAACRRSRLERSLLWVQTSWMWSTANSHRYSQCCVGAPDSFLYQKLSLKKMFEHCQCSYLMWQTATDSDLLKLQRRLLLCLAYQLHHFRSNSCH